MQSLDIINLILIIIVSILSYFGYNKIHVLINSRMSELLVLAKASSVLSREDQDERLKLVGDAEHAKGLLAAGGNHIQPPASQLQLEQVDDANVAKDVKRTADASEAIAAVVTEELKKRI